MNITKAILLTLLLTIIYYIPQLGFVGLFKYTDLIGEGFKKHSFAVLILGSLLSYLIVFYFFWKPLPNLKSYFNIRKLDLKLLPYLLLIAVGLGLVEQVFFDFNNILDYYRTSEIKQHSNKFFGINSFFIYIRFSTLFIAPLFEELFFRKFLFAKLLKNNKIWTSILVSSVCFSLTHFETPNNLIPTFVFGIIACLIYLKTKNIWYTVIIHFLHNLLSMLYVIYGESFFDWIYDLNYNFIYWALFVFGILTTILGVKKITTANKT